MELFWSSPWDVREGEWKCPRHSLDPTKPHFVWKWPYVAYRSPLSVLQFTAWVEIVGDNIKYAGNIPDSLQAQAELSVYENIMQIKKCGFFVGVGGWASHLTGAFSTLEACREKEQVMINAIYLPGKCRQLMQTIHAGWLWISRAIEQHPSLPNTRPPTSRLLGTLCHWVEGAWGGLSEAIRDTAAHPEFGSGSETRVCVCVCVEENCRAHWIWRLCQGLDVYNDATAHFKA